MWMNFSSSFSKALLPPLWKCRAGNVVPSFRMKMMYAQPWFGALRLKLFKSSKSKLMLYFRRASIFAFMETENLKWYNINLTMKQICVGQKHWKCTDSSFIQILNWRKKKVTQRKEKTTTTNRYQWYIRGEHEPIGQNVLTLNKQNEKIKW